MSLQFPRLSFWYSFFFYDLLPPFRSLCSHPQDTLLPLVNSQSLTNLGPHPRSPVNHLPHSEKEPTSCCPFLHLHLFLITELRFYFPIIGIQEISIQMGEDSGASKECFLLSLQTFKGKMDVYTVWKPEASILQVIETDYGRERRGAQVF